VPNDDDGGDDDEYSCVMTAISFENYYLMSLLPYLIDPYTWP